MGCRVPFVAGDNAQVVAVVSVVHLDGHVSTNAAEVQLVSNIAVCWAVRPGGWAVSLGVERQTWRFTYRVSQLLAAAVLRER